MKQLSKLVSILLSLSLLISGCVSSTNLEKEVVENNSEIPHSLDTASGDIEAEDVENKIAIGENLEEFEDKVYEETVKTLNSEEYYVEGVEATYISKEYLEELAYNSQSNIYFGYTLDQVNEMLGDEKFVFTVSDTGETVPQKMEYVSDDTMNNLLKTVGTGSGVIILSMVIANAVDSKAPTTSIILSFAAIGAGIGAPSCAALGGLIGAITEAVRSGDPREIKRVAAEWANNGFKIGAVVGAATGGAVGFAWLNKMTAGGLTIKQAAWVQQASKFDSELISNIQSLEEAKLYMEQGLRKIDFQGKTCYVAGDIDLGYVSEAFSNPNGLTNRELMEIGRSPFSSNDKPFNVHHVGQKADGILIALPEEIHQKFNKILHTCHDNTVCTALTPDERKGFKNLIRPEYWKAVVETLAP